MGNSISRPSYVQRSLGVSDFPPRLLCFRLTPFTVWYSQDLFTSSPERRCLESDIYVGERLPGSGHSDDSVETTTTLSPVGPGSISSLKRKRGDYLTGSNHSDDPIEAVPQPPSPPLKRKRVVSDADLFSLAQTAPLLKRKREDSFTDCLLSKRPNLNCSSSRACSSHPTHAESSLPASPPFKEIRTSIHVLPNELIDLIIIRLDVNGLRTCTKVSILFREISGPRLLDALGFKPTGQYWLSVH
ncbi:hypothetical protein JVT61DRAFT_7688 [Boletus reticuloceps]|uniref:F-box domain-containing protein n=1 Tax=Boletus reticuloceps TaxID=495285 RepID=A0A8I3A7N7_9AGAM|nr:hypothetical protein JVT61DRAFT_7688 [Boletus reticuloceps]